MKDQFKDDKKLLTRIVDIASQEAIYKIESWKEYQEYQTLDYDYFVHSVVQDPEDYLFYVVVFYFIGEDQTDEYLYQICFDTLEL